MLHCSEQQVKQPFQVYIEMIIKYDFISLNILKWTSNKFNFFNKFKVLQINLTTYIFSYEC